MTDLTYENQKTIERGVLLVLKNEVDRLTVPLLSSEIEKIEEHLKLLKGLKEGGLTWNG